MIFWSQTESGWAVNLDGTNAALQFTLPRIEIRSTPRGWACTCHLGNGTSCLVPLRNAPTVAEAMRAGIEGSLPALGEEHQQELRALLEVPRRS
ncbi:MAG TPA: hypothetical protein VFG59_14385 [Anaeromyxobacter sp.]|nr:hypothetical protein [Anaeromyxobacter sp.]